MLRCKSVRNNRQQNVRPFYPWTGKTCEDISTASLLTFEEASVAASRIAGVYQYLGTTKGSSKAAGSYARKPHITLMEGINQKMVGRQKGRFPGKCNHCGKKGHKAAECWSKHPEQRPQNRSTRLSWQNKNKAKI